MKTKFLCLVVAMIAVLAMLASCSFGGGTTDIPPEGGDEGTPEIEYDVTWQKTEIVVKLTNHSNASELTSGCKRYYAGQDTSAFQEIDSNIKTRNQLAQTAANVKIKRYEYIEDSESKGWGANINDMVGDVNSGSQNLPDIYCNFAYDMTCAALRGCFANLLKTNYANGNHFRFVDSDYKKVVGPEDYFNSKAGEGYFYQYMRSLSLTPDTKLYCLASNYTIDVMRAFLVMPVNVEIMNGVSVNDSYAGDRDNDSDHDIEDFYDLVWDGEWNYTALASYCNAVFQSGGDTSKPETDLSDNRVGLALGRGSGLTPSALLYTSSVVIFQQNADGSYSYPAENKGLNDFATALNDLVSNNASKGICVVDKAAGTAVVPTAKSELDAIRNRFATNNVLFGGTIMVGSLEDSVYQAMKNNGQGFGIVPVPVYKAGDEYKTLVHNIARIMAISKASANFAQCSAFLDYQSRTSAEILEDYYGHQLTAAVGGVAGEQNSRMLTYIRNHVNNCFDKTFEDAISQKAGDTDANASATRFHGALMNAEYKVSSFSTLYSTVVGDKSNHLASVWADWQKLD